MIDGGVYMRDVCIAKGQPPATEKTAAMNFISIRMWMETNLLFLFKNITDTLRQCLVFLQ